jgi:hypothetical protein
MLLLLESHVGVDGEFLTMLMQVGHHVGDARTGDGSYFPHGHNGSDGAGLS